MVALAREISRNLLLTYWLHNVSYPFVCILLRKCLCLNGGNVLVGLEDRAGGSALAIFASTCAQHRGVH